VYAIGDCATIETSVLSHLLDFVAEADKNNDGRIDYEEWKVRSLLLGHFRLSLIVIGLGYGYVVSLGR